MRDFKEMFLFAHLEPVYRQRAWVIVDGDTESLDIIENLKASFAGWPDSHFLHWEEPVIERYYPAPFADKYKNEIELIQDKKKKYQAKQELFRELVAWIQEDPERGRQELSSSAAGMIRLLQKIEGSLPALSA